MAKLGTSIWGPITLVMDDFEPFIVDGVYTLVFEDIGQEFDNHGES